MVTFTLTTPTRAGLNDPRTVASLRLTGITFTSVPPLAPIGAGEMTVTLTEPTSGFQMAVQYKDASVLTFFAQAAPAPTSGETIQDIMAQLVFAKLIADGKLPAGATQKT